VTEARVREIERRLQAALAPEWLEVLDESHLHIGHAGARDGRGHFRVRIQAEALKDLGRIAAHRRIHDTMGALMVTDIHALSIELVSLNED
jgi:stress-induced morphogen